MLACFYCPGTFYCRPYDTLAQVPTSPHDPCRRLFFWHVDGILDATAMLPGLLDC
ncbi:hypothetical protein NOR53_98 [gamma proteobacterium NOR5-3]|nr:hypothetical protein NOR53_98 [gamma proteobacterium NOR5-3]